MAEIMADSGTPDITSDESGFTLNAIRAGTVAHTREGEPFTFCAHLLEEMASTWVGGFIKYNHMLPGVGEITASVWEDPYVVMTISGLGDEVSEHLMANRHTGFSIDAAGDPNDPSTVKGTGISILFDEHEPACNAEAGCGLTGTIMANEIDTEAYKLHIDTLTEKLAASEALVAERDQAISEMKTDTQVSEAVAEGIKASEADNVAKTAAKEAVDKLLPEELDEDVKAVVAEALVAEDYHKLLVTLGAHTPKTTTAAQLPTEQEVVAETPVAKSTQALDAALMSLHSKFIGA